MVEKTCPHCAGEFIMRTGRGEFRQHVYIPYACPFCRRHFGMAYTDGRVLLYVQRR